MCINISKVCAWSTVLLIAVDDQTGLEIAVTETMRNCGGLPCTRCVA